METLPSSSTRRGSPDRPPSARTGAALQVTPPPAGDIGAEITGLDTRELEPGQAQEIRRLVYEHKLVVIRDQHLSNEEYVELAGKIGTPQIYFQSNYHHPDHPEIFVSSNVPEDGKKVGVAGTGRYWHTDCQFFEMPLPFTMLYPQQLPEVKRETYFIDMERVLRTMPEELRRHTRGTRAIHQAKWRYKVQPCDIDKSITEILNEFGAVTPTVTHPTEIRHPVTGRDSLYVSEGFTVGIEGLTYEASKQALGELLEFIDRPEHVHTHTWGDADVILWDNRVLIHMASTVPAGQPSVSYRIGIFDGLPFYTNG